MLFRRGMNCRSFTWQTYLLAGGEALAEERAWAQRRLHLDDATTAEASFKDLLPALERERLQVYEALCPWLPCELGQDPRGRPIHGPHT
eukprot:15442575-Alexandrium_andersonii.AAC.1